MELYTETAEESGENRRGEGVSRTKTSVCMFLLCGKLKTLFFPHCSLMEPNVIILSGSHQKHKQRHCCPALSHSSFIQTELHSGPDFIYTG